MGKPKTKKSVIRKGLKMFGLAPLKQEGKPASYTGVCRVCGCTEDSACMTQHGPCSWVFSDVCSACVKEWAIISALEDLTKTMNKFVHVMNRKQKRK